MSEKIILVGRKTGHKAFIIECPKCGQPVGFVSSPPMPDQVGITLEDAYEEARIHLEKKHRLKDFEIKFA